MSTQKTSARVASSRTSRMKEELLSCRYEICIERMKYFTEAHRQKPEAPEIIRRAEGLARTLEHMTIFIRDDELLVGNETGKNLYRAAIGFAKRYSELAFQMMDREMIESRKAKLRAIGEMPDCGNRGCRNHEALSTPLCLGHA